MATFDELTDEELSRLQTIWREYQRLRPLTRNEIYWQFTFRAGDSLGEAFPMVTDWETISLKNHLIEPPKAIPVSGHNIKRWADAGYVDIASAGTNIVSPFMLTPRGQSYLAFQDRPAWQRGLLGWWANRQPETRAAILSLPISVLASVAASVLFTWIALRLGWIHP